MVTYIQISISKNIAEAFKLRNYATVRLKKVLFLLTQNMHPLAE